MSRNGDGTSPRRAVAASSARSCCVAFGGNRESDTSAPDCHSHAGAVRRLVPSDGDVGRRRSDARVLHTWLVQGRKNPRPCDVIAEAMLRSRVGLNGCRRCRKHFRLASARKYGQRCRNRIIDDLRRLHGHGVAQWPNHFSVQSIGYCCNRCGRRCSGSCPRQHGHVHRARCQAFDGHVLAIAACAQCVKNVAALASGGGIAF